MARSHTANPKYGIRSLRGIWRYLWPYRKTLCIVFIALLVTSFTILAISQGLRYVIDMGLSHKDPHMLDVTLFYLLATILILGIATACRYYFITMVGERVAIDMRRDMYRHILQLSVDFYESHKLGDILARVIGDVNELQNLIGSSVSIALRNIVMLAGAIIMMVILNTKLFLLLTIAIPLVVAPIIIVGRYVRYYSRIAQNKVGEVAALAEETVYGIRIVQAYCQEILEHKRFDEKLSQVLGTVTTRVRYRALVTLVVILLVFGGIVYLLWVGGHDVLKGIITPGELSSFLFLGVVCAGAVGALAEVIGDLQKAAGAAERILEFLQVEPRIANVTAGHIMPPTAAGRLKFNNVTFFYESRSDKPVLQDMSFEIVPNKITAIVGESGTGKSTIIQLLLRFYDVQAGAITFDGVDIKQIQLNSLRQQFAYVAQDPVIFSTSVSENVQYGNHQASVEQIREALRAAGALEFVDRLPEGMDTYLGEKGVRLSGGQKQRIAIARAFLRNPRILLLDEATSSLDSSNESIVQQALENLMADRTVIIIAHRLSSIVAADKIIVIKNGQVVEQGQHESLLAKNGVYTQLFNTSEALSSSGLR